MLFMLSAHIRSLPKVARRSLINSTTSYSPFRATFSGK